MLLLMHPEKLKNWLAYWLLLLVLALVWYRSWLKFSILSRLEASHQSGVKLAQRKNRKLETWSCQFQEIYDVCSLWFIFITPILWNHPLSYTLISDYPPSHINSVIIHTIFFCLFSLFTLFLNYCLRSLEVARSSVWVSHSSVLSRAPRMAVGQSKFFPLGWFLWHDPTPR